MALIKCPECGKDVSDTCDQCIHCGFKLKKVNNDYLSKNEEYTPRIIEQKATDKNVMPLGEAKICMVVGPIDLIAGVIFLIILLTGSQEMNGWALFWLVLLIFMIIVGIVATVKGFNAYSYHKRNK